MYDDLPDAHILDEPLQLRGGARTLDRRCDRIPQFDEQSLHYPVRALLKAEGIREPRSYSWAYFQLDQMHGVGRDMRGSGGCGGFGTTMEAAARPVPVFGDPARYSLDEDTIARQARALYYRAQEIDPWEGGAAPGVTPYMEGTSGLAAVKAAVERGWYAEYRWALGPGPEAAAHDVILSLGYFGPVMLGTNWYEDMYDAVPGASDELFLDVSGRAVGGHWWVATRYSKKLDAIWTPNSWGGQGAGWIRRGDLVKLLAEDGEACIPTRRTRR